MADVSNTSTVLSSMAWLEVNTFIKASGLHSLTEPIVHHQREDYEPDEYAVSDQLQQYQKGRYTNQERYRG